jgi:UDP-N-acetyl-D-glucosamine dehydrogenase
MPDYVVGKVAKALNLQGKAMRGSKVLVLGIAYKPNVDDMRESPSVEIMDQLQKHGAHISYSDPWVPVFPKMRRYQFDLESILLDADTIAGFDCVVVATNHDIFDYSMIKNNSKSVVDTRGVFRNKEEHIFSA